MGDWVPFEEGSYLVEQAVLMTPDSKGVILEDAVIDVFFNSEGRRTMNGRGLVRNVLVVEMLEDNDEIDLLLDLGHTFKYLLREPSLQAGKVFSPDTKSILRFAPTAPLEKVPEGKFNDLINQLTFLS